MAEPSLAPVYKMGRPTADASRQKFANILDVAREEFALLGYRVAKMSNIAEKAGVSTRTLYSRYSDKLGLFISCLDSGASDFPVIEPIAGVPPREILRRFGVALVRALSTDSSLRFSTLVYREGREFPDLLRASEANQEQYIEAPLVNYMRQAGLFGDEVNERARLFIAMALAQWQLCVMYMRPLPTDAEITHHIDIAVRIFFDGSN